VLVAALGAFALSLDSAVNVALPGMARAFDTGVAASRWVIICHVLTCALTALAAGMAADRVGAPPVFAPGLWVSAAALLGHAGAGASERLTPPPLGQRASARVGRLPQPPP
jgi:MFS family permease